MISTILVKQRPHIRGQVERREKVLVEAPAADHIDRMIAYVSCAHREQSQRSGILQFLLLQKRSLIGRAFIRRTLIGHAVVDRTLNTRSGETVECDLRIAKL